MLSVQHVLKTLRKAQSGSGDLFKTLKHATSSASSDTTASLNRSSLPIPSTTSTESSGDADQTETSSVDLASSQSMPPQTKSASSSCPEAAADDDDSRRTAITPLHDSTSASRDGAIVSLTSHSNENGSELAISAQGTTTYQSRSEQIHNFYQQQLHRFHTQHNHSLYAKQKQTQFAMSSLAAEPLSHMHPEDTTLSSSDHTPPKDPPDTSVPQQGNTSTASDRPCFHTGFAQILQFMELIGNLKHTKRTGWVLRKVDDCESISGHMYRMSMMTFLLDGTEGLNQIRCMELALVHDLAESLVGDITPFCGVSKEDKRAMEFKAMEDICKLIEPRGKRIMMLFEEYEHGHSAESKFVKDLDRLDMVMQAFEYEKRDNCLLKHQEFFDSTEGKFNHPFVKKLVSEIYEQRKRLASAKGATPPSSSQLPSSNGHCGALEQEQPQKTTSSSTS